MTIASYCVAVLAFGIQIHGTCEYTERGVRWAGFEYAWMEIEELDERGSDRELVELGYEEWSARIPEGAEGVDQRVTLAIWCRDNGLEDESRSLLAQVLELAPQHPAAQRAQGLAQEEGAWKPALDVLARRFPDVSGLAPATSLERAEWCAQHGLRERAWDELAQLAAASGDEPSAEALAALARHAPPAVDLEPILSGRWRVCPPTLPGTQTLFAVELESVDPEGNLTMRPGRNNNYSWRQPVLASAAGTVIEVHQSEADLELGEQRSTPRMNFVRVRLDTGEVCSYLNIQQESAHVAEGELVEAGQVIALVGHQGLAATPRLLFQVTRSVERPQPVGQAGEGGEPAVLQVGVPFRWSGMRLSAVNGEPCRVAIGAARPQPGWRIEVPRRR